MNIILLLFICPVLKNVICVKGKDGSKYIDLLTEKDKQDFLDKTARRILDEFKSKGVPINPAVEVPNDQLDEHNKLLHKIIKEEAENLRVTQKKSTVLRSDSNKGPENEDESAIQVFDLTLRQGTGYINRERDSNKKNINTNNDNATLPVQVRLDNSVSRSSNVTETVTAINKEYYQQMENSNVFKNSTINIESQGVTDTFSRLINKHSKKYKTLTEKNEKKMKINKTTSNDSKKATTKIPNFNNRLEQNGGRNQNSKLRTLSDVTKLEKKFFLNVSDNNYTQMINLQYRRTESTIKTTITDLENVTTVQRNQYNNKGINLKTSAADEIPRINSNVEVAEYLKKSYGENINITDFGNNLHKLTTLKNVLENVGDGHPNSNFSKQPKLTVNTPLEDFVSKISSKDRVIDTKSKNVSGNVKVKKLVTSNNIPNQDILKIVLKSDGHEEKLKPKLKEADRGGIKSIPKPDSYVVSEMPGVKPPFETKSNVKQPLDKEQPHYASVYNYDPSNAYFNFHNRLVPNADEENIESESKNNDSKEYKKINYNSDEYTKPRLGGRLVKKHQKRAQKLQGLSSSMHLPTVHKNKKYNNVHFHADDAFDMDYYYSRLENEGQVVRSKQSKSKTYKKGESKMDAINESEQKDNINSKEKEKEIDESESKHGSDSEHHDKDNKGIKKLEKNLENLIKEPKDLLQEILNNKKTYVKKMKDYLLNHKRFDNTKDLTFKYFKRNRPTNNLNSTLEEEEMLFGIQPTVYKKEISEKSYDEKNWQSKEHFPITHAKKLKLKPSSKFKWQEKNKAQIKVSQPFSNSKNQIKDALANLRAKIRFLGKLLSTKINIEPWGYICLDHPNYLKCKKNYNKYRQTQNPFPEKEIKKYKHVTIHDYEKLINVFLDVLRDMIKTNNEGLKKYDWLGTAIDIQAALNKLAVLLNGYQKGRETNTKDLQLLDYMAYLYKSSKNTLRYKTKKNKKEISRFPLKGKTLLPKARKLTSQKIQNPLLQLDKARNHLRQDIDEIEDRRRPYDELLYFVNDLTDYLSDLHDAIKHIAMVTTYKKQRWYENLKELYIGSPTKKVLIQILLHMFATEVFALIGESANNGLQEDYKLNIHHNHKEVNRIKETLTIILVLMQQIKD